MNADWLAGFVDADGSFTIGRRIKERSDGTTYLRFQPVVNIRQKAKTGTGLLEDIHEWLGFGRMYTSTRDDGTSVATWQTTSLKEVLQVGGLLYDKLMLKGQEAIKAMRCAYLMLEADRDDPDVLWELYTLYRDINPDGNWADRKTVFTREQIELIAVGNQMRKGKKDKGAYDGLNSLPEKVLHEVIK